MLCTDSMASGLLVPITPVGPRLIQPATYSPTTGSWSRAGSMTRPSTLGMRPDHASNGTPASGTPM